LAAGILLQLPIISAQETSNLQEDNLFFGDEQLLDENPHLTNERNLTFTNDGSSDLTQPGMDAWAIVQMVLVLVLAAAAIYGVVFIIKRASKRTVVNDPYLKVLANSHLGANRYVHIVSVGSRVWLLGASDGGVNLISEIDDKDVINAMLLDDSRKSADNTQGRFPDFLSILKRMGTSVQPRTPGANEIRKRRERLKGL